MALDGSAAKEIKSQMAIARKRELAFGLCFGKKIEGSVFLTHKTKASKVLGKQAKADGETPLVTFGRINLKGTDLTFAIDGKILPGFARKMKQLFKVVGLKYSIIVLDPSGAVIESEGDEDGAAPTAGQGQSADTPGKAPAPETPKPGETAEDTTKTPEQPDPLVEKWEKAAAKIEAVLAKLVNTRGIDLSQANTLWRAIHGKAGSGDHKVALENIPKMSEAMKKAAMDVALLAKRQSLLEAKWQQASAKLEPLVAEVLAFKTPQTDKIQAAWAMIKSKVSASPPDYETALKAVGPLARAISEARASAPAETVGAAAEGGETVTAPNPEAAAAPRGPTDETPPETEAAALPEVDLAEQIARIEATIKSLKDGPIATYNTMIAEAVSTIPDAWDTALKDTAKLAADAKATPLPESAAKLDVGEKSLAGLRPAIAAQTRAKTGFKKALDIFDLRLVPLTSHPKAAAPEIAPEITKITDIRASAIEKSKNHDLKAATDELTAAEAVIAATEILADDFAHFDAIDDDRKVMADTDRGKVAGDPKVDAPAREMEGLYDGAQVDRAAKKFKDAIIKLDKVAEIFTSTAKIKKLKAKYENDRPIAKTWVDSWVGLSAATALLLATKLAEANGHYTDSDIATTSDYAVSLQKLKLFWPVRSFLKQEIPTVQQYPPKLAAFEIKLTDFKAHDGASGIQVMILKMDADLVTAKAEAALHKFSTATAVLAGTEGDWPATLAVAVNCKAYKEKRVIVQGKIDALKNVPQATSLIEATKALMSDAAISALKPDFDTAGTILADAEKRVDTAKAAAEDSVELDGLHDETALDDLKDNWNPAFKVYTDIRDKVVAADSGNHLTALIAKAQLPAAEARKAHTANKLDDARAHLDSAILNLKMALVLIHEHTAYLDIKTSLETRVTALTPLNDLNCLQPHIDKIDVLKADADDLIKPEAYDYKGAEAKLAGAGKVVDLAKADGTLFVEIKSNRAIATAVIGAIATEGGAVATQLAHRVTEVQTLLDDSDALQTAEDFKGAAAKAKAAANWADPTAADIKTLKTVLGWEIPFFSTPRAALTGPGKEASVHQIARADADFATYGDMKTAHTYSAALRMFEKAYQKITACKLLQAQADLYAPALTAAEAALTLLDGERNTISADMIKEVEDKLATAKIDATKTDLTDNSYSQATKLMQAVTAQATALLDKIKGSSAYETARKAAREKLDEAQAHKHADAIEAQLTRLTTKYENLVKLAPGDFATAKKMAEEVAVSAQEATKTADNHATLEAVNSAIGGDEDSAPWWPQIKAAQLSIAFVGSKEHADVAKTYLETANGEIANCQKDGLAAKVAKAHLLAALAACNTADEVMSQYAFFVQSIAHARTALIPVTGHSETAYVTTNIAEIEKLLTGAETTAKTGQNFDNVSADLEAAIALIKTALDLANHHKEYIDLRAKVEVEPRLAELEAHEHRYAIKPSIDTMRKKLADAATQVEARNPADAIKLLEKARAIGTGAFVMAEMRANTPPDPKLIDEILSRPNGIAELDAMIDNLEPEAQRAVVKVAFKARFGCEIENFSNKNLAPGTVVADLDLKGPNIVAFYKVMQDLPLDHTLDNDSMSKFSIIDASGQGSKYQGSKKNVVMHEGDATTSSPYPFGSDDAVGSLDDATTPEERAEIEKCKPANEEPVTFFNWNTLHEVAHAVDDKGSFMTSNGKKKEFGGWIEYGSNISAIAEKIAKKFEYDKGYATEYMAHNKSPYVPAIPADETCTEEEWESRRLKLRAHIDAASEPAKPWSSMAHAKNLAIGGIVYQESYSNKWMSYLLSARAKGITAYQFRAPGEWFSELYAAYHSGKLKPGHPSEGWLSNL
ncbi:MAG: hypothetical protein L3J36_03940 [Rhodobacteraceae bacterium]|nr:hypothetical protein [Paracoccaceae bacterium]